MTDNKLISDFFAPDGYTKFFDTTYEKSWLHLDDIRDDLCSLFTSSDLESYLFKSRAWVTENPWRDAGVLCAKYPNGGFKADVSNVEELLAKFAEEHTIVLQQSQKRWKKIAEFCAVLSEKLNARVGANIYITPPNSQGFTAHYDMHDVFLLQTEGTKVWKVKSFDKVPLTLVGSEYENEFPAMAEQDSEGSTVINLTAGQRLYMPRGTIHQGVAFNDLPSVHITFGIKPVTWYDIVSLQVFHPENLHSSLSQSVPFKYLQDIGSETTKEKLKEISDLISFQNVDEGIMQYLHQRTNSLNPSSRFEAINKIGTISLESYFTLSQSSAVEVLSNKWVTFGAKKYLIPQGFTNLMQLAIESKCFLLGQMAKDNEKIAIEFGRWLVKSGFATFTNKEK